MDDRRFDALARSLAAPKTRRGVLGGLVAFAAGALGASAKPCPPGHTRNKKGDCSCPPATDACPDGCYDLKRDVNNCGACGRTCIGGTCKKGECLCPAGTVLCDGICRSQASFAADPDNCGGCGISCDDGDACTTDTCSGGICQHTPVSCDDNNACTTDTCNPVLGCQHQAISCDDSNPCTDDSCNTATGCVNTPNANPCTTEERRGRHLFKHDLRREHDDHNHHHHDHDNHDRPAVRAQLRWRVRGRRPQRLRRHLRYMLPGRQRMQWRQSVLLAQLLPPWAVLLADHRGLPGRLRLLLGRQVP